MDEEEDAPRSGRSTRRAATIGVFASGLRNPERHGLGAADRRALDRRQRARRARQRPRSRLPDLGARRRLLRLAVQLLRQACRYARRAAATRTWSRTAMCPITRSARTRHRSASPSTKARGCRRFADGMFIGQHGSWNRKPRSGYKVIFVPFSAGARGTPMRCPDRIRRRRGQAQGRPVGVAIDTQGGLLVADDVGNTIWRVTACRHARRQERTRQPNVSNPSAAAGLLILARRSARQSKRLCC